MKQAELAYYELYGLAEEANEEIKRVKAAIPQLSKELHLVLDEMFNKTRRPDMQYCELAARVRATSNELTAFRKHWDELTHSLDAIGFQLFLAEGHALVHMRDMQKRERYKTWHGNYRNY